ncbi:uncharacterized protein BDV17DRAFT_295822 [Aspergillus undulatus]|uniref:uncharacterized protein n=1 Tax=Aspergillus undulatus TaxID=1810928 RepID=UPI003CCCB544
MVSGTYSVAIQIRNAYAQGTIDAAFPWADNNKYLPKAESLNCDNHVDALYPQVKEGLEEIYKVGVVHEDIYPKYMLLVRDGTESEPNRLMWIYFDVATIFTELREKEAKACEWEMTLVSLGSHW